MSQEYARREALLLHVDGWMDGYPKPPSPKVLFAHMQFTIPKFCVLEEGYGQ